MTDLFTTPELIPEQVRIILDDFAESEEYDDLTNLKVQLNAVGYTFDYDLHCEPYNLRKL